MAKLVSLTLSAAIDLLIKGFLIDAIETITSKEIKKYFLNKLEKVIDEYR